MDSFAQPFHPYVVERGKVTAIRFSQGVEILDSACFVSHRIGRWKIQFVAERHQQDATDAAVEVLEWVYPLEAPICPRQERGDRLGITDMFEALGKIATVVLDIYRDIVWCRREMCANLDFGGSIATGPVWEKFAGKLLVSITNPVAGDIYVVWIFVQ